jgi:DNA-binding response OmpR family regulator
MRTILVAEDQQELRDLIALSLQLSGYQVLAAQDGELAYRWAKDLQPDLILLDLEMPQLRGSQVCEKLKAMDSFSETPILIMSSHSDPIEIEKSIEAGAEAFLHKPFELNDLISKVDALLTQD